MNNEIAKFIHPSNTQIKFALTLDIISENECCVTVIKSFCGINFKVFQLYCDTYKDGRDLYDILYINMEKNYVSTS